jgi:hypothetical protein
MPSLIDMLNIVLALFGIGATMVIFFMQQRLSKQQVEFARCQGELELREKFGPIQSHVLELRTETRRFKNLASELQGSLVLFSKNPEICQQLSNTNLNEVERRINSILSERGRWPLLNMIKELQNEESVVQDFRQLDRSIEGIQRDISVSKLSSQSEYDTCQNHIRSLLETATELAQRSVFLLTDCRAVEAVYTHATEDTKVELGTLLSEFWYDPLNQLPVPPTYKGDKFNGIPLTQTLEKEVREICEYLIKR